MKKVDYSSMFTLRSDGRYMGYWRELDRNGEPTGPRHAIYDKDPEKLHRKIQKKETPTTRTLKDVAGEWEDVHRTEVSERTWANYAPHLEQIVSLYGDRAITDIGAFEVSQDLLAAKGKGYSHTVVNARRSIWRGIFDHAIAQRDIPYNPAASVKLPKGLKKGKRTAPPDEAINRIIQNADDMEFGFIPFFLLCTGVRRSEALQRKKTDLNTKTWELTIPKAKTDAGVRTVPIIQPLREPLLRWMDAHPGEWLFPHVAYNGHTGTFMSDRNWETAWKRYCAQNGWIDATGKPTLGAHNLRHGTATLLYEAEVDLFTAQHVLGHANVSTTLEIYTELRKNYERKNVGKFSRSMTKLQTKLSKAQKKPATP
jgi:integrase